MSTNYPIAERMERIQPFFVMDLLARARRMEAEGRSIIHMEIGEPDFPTPQPVIAAGHRALDEKNIHYTPAVGLSSLRSAIATFYHREFGVDIDAERIVITPGSSGGLQLVLGVLINPGDQVLMADPGYPCNRHFVTMLGGEPIGVPVDADSGYQLTLETIQRAWGPRSRAVMIASPSNPTGTLIPEETLRAIDAFVRECGGVLIVDEIYQNLVYGRAPVTALSNRDDLFVISSFSKYFGMTGWRLGWVVAPEGYVEALDRLAQNIFLSAPTLSQYAALAAFAPDNRAILEERRREFQRRRDYLVPALVELGFEIPVKPEGAFYIYADCTKLSFPSSELYEILLEKAGVAVTPGYDFGHHAPERHLRFAYTTTMENLQEGVERIRRVLETT